MTKCCNVKAIEKLDGYICSKCRKVVKPVKDFCCGSYSSEAGCCDFKEEGTNLSGKVIVPNRHYIEKAKKGKHYDDFNDAIKKETGRSFGI